MDPAIGTWRVIGKPSNGSRLTAGKDRHLRVYLTHDIMKLTDTFPAYMKTNTLMNVPSAFAFNLWGSKFHVITDGTEYGIVEEVTGCLICGPFNDPYTALGNARHKLELEYSKESFEKIKIKRVKEAMQDLHE